jgi:hypothetical protein
MSTDAGPAFQDELRRLPPMRCVVAEGRLLPDARRGTDQRTLDGRRNEVTLICHGELERD